MNRQLHHFAMQTGVPRTKAYHLNTLHHMSSHFLNHDHSLASCSSWEVPFTGSLNDKQSQPEVQLKLKYTQRTNALKPYSNYHTSSTASDYKNNSCQDLQLFGTTTMLAYVGQKIRLPKVSAISRFAKMLSVSSFNEDLLKYTTLLGKLTYQTCSQKKTMTRYITY